MRKASYFTLCGYMVVAVGLFVATVPEAVGGDLAAGQALVRKRCAACHGVDGIAKQPHVPHLAGENKLYLTRQLKAFRSGKRKNPQMTLMAKKLTDANIADVAAWYAAIRITVTLPSIE